MQVCLKCAREESREDRTVCHCGGTLWTPQHVGGRFGSTDMDEAIRLIRAGKKPWEADRR